MPEDFGETSSSASVELSVEASVETLGRAVLRYAQGGSQDKQKATKDTNAFVAFVLGYGLGRALRVTPISRYQKTSHPRKPASKLPTIQLAKLTKSLFSQRQPRRCMVGWPQRWILASVSFWH